ncbi:DUF2807 domain-containing protein [Pricia sp. S334]|uniref:DUF2807 domain-containing protein n=1 Tax=Pricia mediterranea TaxID=3076079 RepID=A0ABU3L6Z3_9FLAO|nr:DUF2807 domain-containing protein [Pricia sp. S334]MDT7829514.1 DUF2807 domain-containing protein [Pricia sp. S334]
MKNILFFTAFIICFQLSAQRKPKIKGSRIVTDVQQNLSPFHTIELNDDIEVRLRKAPQPGYAITADDNLIDVLKFEVKDSVLVISSFYTITGKKKLDITVNYTDIDALNLSNGDIRMDGPVVTDELKVKMADAAKLQLNAEANRIEITMDGKSSGDFTLTGDTMDFVLNGRADARIYTISGTNDLKIYRNAGAIMEGTVDTFNATLLDNTSLKGERLEADMVFLKVQNSASAKVQVNSKIELTASGSSKTYVHGDGEIELVEFSDTSELHREK